MKKKLISAAVMLGVSGAATAVNVNPDGIGQVLLYPYYTVNDGKSTNVHVVNTTDQVKAVKIRFNEGVNTWEVLDFNIYLSPYDVWAGGLGKNVEGKPFIYTSDTSCTTPKVPSSVEGGQVLRSTNIDLYAASTEPAEFTLTADQRLTEGHIELIEMGTIDPNSVIGQAVTHVNGVPADCGAVTTAWLGGNTATGIPNWNNDPTLTAPSGGLFGSADIFDVESGISRGYNATAIEGLLNASAHVTPGNAYPNLNGDLYAGSANGVANLTNVGNTTSYVIYPDANGLQAVFASEWDTPVQALSAVLTADSVYNEYTVEDGVNAATDWVVTFPTKHFFVNGNTTTADGGSGQNGLGKAIAPFVNGFFIPLELQSWSREERTAGAVSGSLDFSPSTTSIQAAQLAYEVNVLEFDDTINVWESQLSNGGVVDQTYISGWSKLDFGTAVSKSAVISNNGDRYVGLPVLGFAAIESQNGTLNGGSVLANYSSIFPHRYGRVITSSTDTGWGN